MGLQPLALAVLVAVGGAALAVPGHGSSGSHASALIAYRGAGVTVVDADGMALSSLGPTGCPAWSPDGQWLAAGETGIDEEGIYVLRSNGTGVRRVAAVPVYGHGRPDWSRDGRRLIFNTDGGRIGVIDVVARKHRLLAVPNDHAPDPEGYWDPVWSPDGRRIAFTRLREHHEDDGKDRHEVDILVMGADGRRRRVLARNASNPAWSPDGRMIAFVRPGAGLWVMAATGREQRQVSAREALPRFTWPDRRRLFTPVWSPDSRRLAFQTFVDARGRWEIFLVGANGQDELNVTRSDADERSPDWSSDGDSIVYSHTKRAVKQIWVVDVDGTDRRRVTEGGRGGWFDECPTWSPAS